MNVLYINTIFWGGGAEKVTRQLYYGMKDNNTKTFFMAGRYQKNVPKEINIIYKNFFERAFSALLGTINHNFIFRTILARKKIIEFIEKEKIDIVHFHNIHGNYIGPADIMEIKRHCNNVIITMHDMWLITGCCPHGMSCNRWRNGGRCRGCLGNEWLRWKARHADRYLEAKAKNLARSGIYFVSPSKWLINCCENSYLSSESIQLIPNGVNVKKFRSFDKRQMRRKHQLPLDKHIIFFSANQINSPYKGVNYLIDALMNLPEKENYFLLIVGNGDVSKLISHFAVHTVGYVKDERLLNELYSAADIFVLPSMADTFPLVMLESMASGTPVLAFRTGGIPEAVTDEVGWCVDVGNSAALTNMLIHIFKSKEEYTQKAQQCRKYILEQFTEELMLERYRELYKKI